MQFQNLQNTHHPVTIVLFVVLYVSSAPRLIEVRITTNEVKHPSAPTARFCFLPQFVVSKHAERHAACGDVFSEYIPLDRTE